MVAWPLLAVVRWDGSYQELPALSLTATSKNSAQCGLDVRSIVGSSTSCVGFSGSAEQEEYCTGSVIVLSQVAQ